MFFSSSSPLRTEADNWFLRELRGRYDLALKYIATHAGCTNADLESYVHSVDPEHYRQMSAYIKVLKKKYNMIEHRQPVFARSKAKKGRFYIRDNFLRSWLAALAVPASAINFRPLPELVSKADTALQIAEGHGLERLVWTLYAERSRKGLGDFRLTQHIDGYWDRSDVEIDLVALDEEEQRLRLGTCKRNPARLITDLDRFSGHCERFIAAFPRFSDWRIERVAIAPELTSEQRHSVEQQGFIPQDLQDLTRGLG